MREYGICNIKNKCIFIDHFLDARAEIMFFWKIEDTKNSFEKFLTFISILAQGIISDRAK